MTETLWCNLPSHRAWLMQQAQALWNFYHFSAINPNGGFFELTDTGNPATTPRQLHSTTRMVHCFAIAQLLGWPGADSIVDHGMKFLWEKHRDQSHGGYFWSLDDNGVCDGRKQAYGHAFVLLAASSAKIVKHPLADKLLLDISDVLEKHFWEEKHGTVAEEFSEDWTPISNYRGQNSNMHLVESLMAAFESTKIESYLHRAERIANLVIGNHAKKLKWRVAEHFDHEWRFDPEYRGSDVFRPAGTTPGHWLEWSRLLLQLWYLGGREHNWMPDASARLFRNAIDLGWDRLQEGFFYTLNWDNSPMLRQKLWWPVCEAIGACAFLSAHFKEPYYEEWYRRLWGLCNLHFIDHQYGGWRHELTEDLSPAHSLFSGRPDIYHALQACLIPLFSTTGSLTSVISEPRY